MLTGRAKRRSIAIRVQGRRLPPVAQTLSPTGTPPKQSPPNRVGREPATDMRCPLTHTRNVDARAASTSRIMTRRPKAPRVYRRSFIRKTLMRARGPAHRSRSESLFALLPPPSRTGLAVQARRYCARAAASHDLFLSPRPRADGRKRAQCESQAGSTLTRVAAGGLLQHL